MKSKQAIDPVEEWLKAENRPTEDQNIFMDFTVTCGKSSTEIIAESKKPSSETVCRPIRRLPAKLYSTTTKKPASQHR